MKHFDDFIVTTQMTQAGMAALPTDDMMKLLNSIGDVLATVIRDDGDWKKTAIRFPTVPLHECSMNVPDIGIVVSPPQSISVNPLAIGNGMWGELQPYLLYEAAINRGLEFELVVKAHDGSVGFMEAQRATH